MRGKFFYFGFLASLICLLSSSCIKSEPLNAECDILTAYLPENILNRKPDIRNDKVIFVIKPGVDIKALAPEFTLTPGAVIEPPSGTVRDFSSPQLYVVTSENKEWSKTYTVEVDDNANVTLNYNFDKANIVNGYYEFYETDPEGNVTMTWATANSAFVFTGMAKSPEQFPTYQADNGKGSKCVAMQTCSTGTFGSMAKKPIAAGSIFIGKFDTANALAQPLKATQFGGRPFYDVPLYFKGAYKYLPGAVYQELNSDGKLQDVPGKEDKCNIYSVFYEITDDMEWLDGTNVMSPDNPNIVAIARFTEEQQCVHEDWSEFSLPFHYLRDVDPQKLEDGKYSITIVASSSADGEFFAGAIGSTLMVDLLSLSCINDYQIEEVTE